MFQHSGVVFLSTKLIKLIANLLNQSIKINSHKELSVRFLLDLILINLFGSIVIDFYPVSKISFSYALFYHVCYLTIGSCFSVHYRVMEHAGSLESTKEA